MISDNVIIAISGLIFLLIVILIFKKKINQASKVNISLQGISLEAPSQNFATMFEKMYSKLLKRDHIEFFRKLSSNIDSPTVLEMIPDFDRENQEWVKSDRGIQVIGMLRALRGLGFIEPKEGGAWKSDSHVLITEFGKEFREYMKT